jgi:hypothetical protein
MLCTADRCNCCSIYTVRSLPPPPPLPQTVRMPSSPAEWFISPYESLKEAPVADLQALPVPSSEGSGSKSQTCFVWFRSLASRQTYSYIHRSIHHSSLHFMNRLSLHMAQLQPHCLLGSCWQ